MQQATSDEHWEELGGVHGGGEEGGEPEPLDQQMSRMSISPSTFGTAKGTPNMEKNDYRYSLLPNPKTYIRLLTFTSEGEESVGSLKAFPISEAPQFCALSYAWGTDPPTSSLTCDYARLAVTEHLLSGIQRVRRYNPTPWIWIDAICINQMDNEEKADQIPLMEKIYSLATHVLVWLGKVTDETEQALDELVAIRDSLRLVETDILHKSQYIQVGLPAAKDPIWKYLSAFLCLSWFKRLWVLQEVVLAKYIIFICGDQAHDFESLRSFGFEITRAGIDAHLAGLASNRRDCLGYKILADLGTLREKLSSSTLSSVSLLQHGRYLLVKEPVDRVYGLLGIMEERIKQAIIVDYSDTARAQYWTLYISVGKLMIQLGYIDLLMLAESEDRLSQLPSWVPNWNSHQRSALFAMHFHAGYNPRNHIPLDNVLPPASNSLQVRGFQIGTILGTSNLEWKNAKDENEFQGPEGIAAHNLNVIDDAFALYQGFCHDPDVLMLERFSRTLVADTGGKAGTGEESKYRQDTREDYEWFRKYLLDWKHPPEEGAAMIDQHDLLNHAAVYGANISKVWRHRSFFVTDTGLIGLCSQSCRPGDIVCIFLSLKHTFVVRKVPGESSVTLVCCAYTDGVMYGEALDGWAAAQEETFIID